MFEIPLYITMERFRITHNGRMDGKIDGAGWDKTLAALIRENTFINFNADWKTFLYFLHEIGKNEILTFRFDDTRQNSR